jgi:hypothetical protein
MRCSSCGREMQNGDASCTICGATQTEPIEDTGVNNTEADVSLRSRAGAGPMLPLQIFLAAWVVLFLGGFAVVGLRIIPAAWPGWAALLVASGLTLVAVPLATLLAAKLKRPEPEPVYRETGTHRQQP